MKIFLIGKKGQVGREIVIECKKLGYKIFGYDSSELDVTDHEKVRRLIKLKKPDVVINTASYHILSECEKNPDRLFKINVFASKNIAEICNELNIKYVDFSSDKVFDGSKKKPYKENDSTNPLQMYGLACLSREIIGENYNKNSIIIRTCGIFGGLEGSRVKGGNFVLYILKESKNKKEIEIASDYLACFVNANDLAKAILKLIKNKKSKGIYHLVNEGYGSWADFAKEIIKLANKDTKIIPVKRGGNYNNVKVPEYGVLKNIKAKKEGIILPHWKEGLKKYIEFLEPQL